MSKYYELYPIYNHENFSFDELIKRSFVTKDMLDLENEQKHKNMLNYLIYGLNDHSNNISNNITLDHNNITLDHNNIMLDHNNTINETNTINNSIISNKKEQIPKRSRSNILFDDTLIDQCNNYICIFINYSLNNFEINIINKKNIIIPSIKFYDYDDKEIFISSINLNIKNPTLNYDTILGYLNSTDKTYIKSLSDNNHISIKLNNVDISYIKIINKNKFMNINKDITFYYNNISNIDNYYVKYNQNEEEINFYL